MSRSRKWLIGGAAGLVLLVGAVVAVVLIFFSSDAPERADIEDAKRSAGSTTAPVGTTVGAASLDGEWTVDTSIGDFSDFSSTWAGYRINEELQPIGTNAAAGRTPGVEGELTIDGTTISDVAVTVDMTTLVSDRSQRDNALRGRGLETDRFPTATFTLTQPVELDAIPESGVTLDVEATGDLTLHGVTKRVTIPMQASLVNGTTIAVTGNAEIALADYGIEKPTAQFVLSIEDTGELELQVFFTKPA